MRYIQEERRLHARRPAQHGTERGGGEQETQRRRLEDPIARLISKPATVGIAFGVLLFGVIVYQTFSIRQVECDVCVEFDGRTKCLTVRGEDEAQVIQTGKDNACSFVTVGRAEAFRCAGMLPSSTQCRLL